MQNIPIKILIISSVTVLSIWCVLTFIKLQVEPPKIQDDIQPFKKNMENYVQSFPEDQNFESNYAYYFTGLDRASYFIEEELISETEYENFCVAITDAYIARLNKNCMAFFQKRSWPKEQIVFIGLNIDYIKHKKVGNESILNKIENDSQLNEISSVIENYNTIKALLSNTAYTDISTSKKKISQLNNYMNKQYMSNCSELVSAVAKYPRLLEDAHYQYMNRQLRTMEDLFGDYYFYSDKSDVSNCEAFCNASKNFVDAHEQYKEDAGNVYGYSRSLEALDDEFDNYTAQSSCHCY